MNQNKQTITIRSTSQNHAEGIDIPLRENTKNRLIFRAEIVNNLRDPQSCVRGRLLYQKKENGKEWEDFEKIDLRKLPSGEGFQLELHSSEIKKLIEGIQHHKEIFEHYGIPFGKAEYVLAPNEVASLVNKLETDPQYLSDFLSVGGADILPLIMQWLTDSDDSKELIEKMSSLNLDSLTKVNNVLGVSQLRKVLEIWESNKHNSDEEFWQKTFADHSWVLSQIFASPVVILHEKAYVGGKSLANTSGQVVDFILQNQMTKNVSLIEIKTPICGLIREEYRPPKVHNPSKDVVGGISQLLSQKHSLLEEAKTLQANTSQQFFSFQPRCILICGSFESPELTLDEMRSFELYRQNSRDVEIITFDELFKKIENMIQLLDGKLPILTDQILEDLSDDIPF